LWFILLFFISKTKKFKTLIQKTGFFILSGATGLSRLFADPQSVWQMAKTKQIITGGFSFAGPQRRTCGIFVRSIKKRKR